MKIYNKIIGLLMSLCLLAGFTACNDSVDYDMAEVPGNAQVYFPSSVSTTQTLSFTGSSFTIPVYRLDTTGALTVPVTFSCEEEGLFTFPTEAVFADGSNSTTLEVGYNVDAFNYNEYVNFTATIDPTLSTPYGLSSVTFKAGVPAPWKTLGWGSYTEIFYGDWYGCPLTYPVQIQESEITPGLYRLIDPYGPVYPYFSAGEDRDKDDTNSYDIEIDATDPDKVIINKQSTGTDWGYGDMNVYSIAAYYIDNGRPELAEAYYGKLENGVITFPASALCICFEPTYPGPYIVNNSGTFSVVLPGYEVVSHDYSLDVAYTGAISLVDGSYSLITNLTKGEDVATVEYYLIEESLVNDFLSGTYDGELVATVTEGGEVRVPAEAGKNYLIYVVGYDADGNYVGYAYDANFSLSGANKRAASRSKSTAPVAKRLFNTRAKLVK
jgi:hypothetical protein